MSKHILILAGSPRKNGNSAALCRAFARGAEESGHQVETVFCVTGKSVIAWPAITAKKVAASASSRMKWPIFLTK